MQLLYVIATWLVGLIGVLVLLICVVWLFDVLVEQVVLWWRVKDVFIAFCFDRHKCTCGALKRGTN